MKDTPRALLCGLRGCGRGSAALREDCFGLSAGRLLAGNVTHSALGFAFLQPLAELRIGLSIPVIEAIGHQRKDHQKEKQQEDDEAICKVVWYGSAVLAATLARLVTVRRRPTSVTVAVLVTIAHPMSVTLRQTLLQFDEGGILTLAILTHHAVSTLGSCHYKSRIGGVSFVFLH